MITEVGKELRKIRIDHDERLLDMGKKLGCTASFISAIELGHKTAPEGFIEKVVTVYQLNEEAAARLWRARNRSIQRFKLSASSAFAQDTAALLASRFHGLPEEKMRRIREVLEEQEVSGGKRVRRPR